MHAEEGDPGTERVHAEAVDPGTEGFRAQNGCRKREREPSREGRGGVRQR